MSSNRIALIWRDCHGKIEPRNGKIVCAMEHVVPMGIHSLPYPCVVISTLLFGVIYSAAAENSFRVGEDKGGVKEHPEGSEECRQGDLGENISHQSAVTGSWPQPSAAMPGAMLGFAWIYPYAFICSTSKLWPMLINGRGVKDLLLNLFLSHCLPFLLPLESEEEDRHTAGHSESAICN